MHDESKRPNILEIELACELLSELLHAREQTAAAVMTEPNRERSYELAFEGLSDLWDELRAQYGDQLAPTLAQMTIARYEALRRQVQQRERLERSRG